MATNRVSAVLSQAESDAVLAILNSAREKLPFLIDLTPEERKKLPRFGDKSFAFAEKALDLVKQNPDFVPKSFDLAEMQRDLELFKSLKSLLSAINKLAEVVEETAIAAGSEAYVAALLIYEFAKADTAEQAGLEGAADELAKRFVRKSRSVKEVPPLQT